LKISAIQLLSNASQNTKLAASVSGATTTSSLAMILEWIPNDISKLGILVGLALSITLIFVHFKKIKREDEKEKRYKEKHKLEMEILRKKLNK